MSNNQQEFLFSTTVRNLFEYIETLRKYFLQGLIEYNINDVTCGVFMSQYLHGDSLNQSPNDGRLCFVLIQKITNNEDEFKREVSISIDKKICNITFKFTPDFTESEEFKGNIKKLTEEKFVDVLVDFFGKKFTDYNTKEKRVALVAKLSS